MNTVLLKLPLTSPNWLPEILIFERWPILTLSFTLIYTSFYRVYRICRILVSMTKWSSTTETVASDISNHNKPKTTNEECGTSILYLAFTNDAHHEKTDLKVFVVVIPKEGWTRMAAPILLLVWHQKKDGRSHARPSFFWYDNHKDLKVCFLVTRGKWFQILAR